MITKHCSYFKQTCLTSEWMLLQVHEGAGSPGSLLLLSTMSLRPVCMFPFFVFSFWLNGKDGLGRELCSTHSGQLF